MHDEMHIIHFLFIGCMMPILNLFFIE